MPHREIAEYALYVRRYAPFRTFGGGFEGDDRNFSTSMQVTSRTSAVVTFGLRLDVGIRSAGQSSGSAWIGPGGIRRRHRLGEVGVHRGQVNVTVLDVSAHRDGLSFTVHSEGNLPIKDILLHRSISTAIDAVASKWRPDSRRPQGLPDIDTLVDFQVRVSGRRMQVRGVLRGDGFPNTEIFLLDDRGRSMALLDFRSRSGWAGPLYRLFGTGANNVLASFQREVELEQDGSFGHNSDPSPVIVKEP